MLLAVELAAGVQQLCVTAESVQTLPAGLCTFSVSASSEKRCETGLSLPLPENEHRGCESKPPGLSM